MGTKISLETQVDEVQDLDDFVLARPPDNFKVQLAGLHYRETLGNLFGGAGSWLNFTPLGNVEFVLSNLGTTYEFWWQSNLLVSIDVNGSIELSGVSGQTITLFGPGGSETTFASDGSISVVPFAGQTITIEGFIGSSGNWAGDPVHMWEAIERLAAAVAGLLGNPIP